MKNENAESVTYLNTAAVGLVSPESIAAAQKFQEGTLTDSFRTFVEWMQEDLPYLREKVAQLVHGHPNQIAFTPNFSYSIQSIAENLRPKVNKVLLFKEDYPSLNMPFELGDFDVHYVESKNGFSISTEEMKAICRRENIKIIAISHVQYLTGFTLDIQTLGDFCREEGIVFIVDTTQSLSAVELNFNSLPIDVMISSSYKWLNGGPGSAILAVKQDFIDQFPPCSAGFGSTTQVDGRLNYEPSIKSYEPGHLNSLGLLQLVKSVEQRLKTGVSEVTQHNSALLKRLASGLEKTTFEICGGSNRAGLSTILCFYAEETVRDELFKNNISVTWRNGLIRVSPHFYNTEKDIDHLLAVLMQIEKR